MEGSTDPGEAGGTGDGRLTRIANWDIDDSLELTTKVKAFFEDPKKRRWAIGILVGTAVTLAILLFTGRLAGLYRSLFEWFPGRQWTGLS